MNFIRREDGSTAERLSDGSLRPVATQTDWRSLDALTDDEIEAMAASDPDHPALDDTFWDEVDRAREPASVRIDSLERPALAERRSASPSRAEQVG